MSEQHATSDSVTPQLGILANLPQFSLLVLINAFVGAMVGLERSILPLIAETEFGLASRSAILTFLVSFGIVKAFTNLVAGRLSDSHGRKKLLMLGWLIGLPVPFLLMWAPSWSWVVAANILLGVNQGLCWSMTVIMKIDLAGPKRRGLAMGLNEFAGYLAVAVVTYLTAAIAAEYGLRPAPFYLGAAIACLGLICSFLVRETSHHVKLESSHWPTTNGKEAGLSFLEIFKITSWRDKNLRSCSQAGLVNNLNDGMAWGLLPLFFASLGFSINRIGFLAALYPATWGLAQLVTGAMSDRFGRKWMIAAGMWTQAIGIWMIALGTSMQTQAVACILLGLGTAMVYPTLLAAVSDAALPQWRGSAVGVYRLWRDLGYAVGALLSGIIADLFGLQSAMNFIGILTFFSGIYVALHYSEQRLI